MKFRYSIVTRFALFFTGLIIFSILLTGYLVFQKAAGVIVQHSRDRIMHASELAEQSFYAVLGEVSNDIAVIAASPTLQNYVNDPTAKTVGDIELLFRDMLENKTSYFQIRLIGTEDNGREIIRFDKSKGSVFRSDTLQQKGNLDYVKETVRLDEGEFYFSKINLNEEYGVISSPPTPTVRAASPIFRANGQLMGVLVINVNLGRLYSSFAQISRAGSQLYVIDESGQYLYNPDAAKQFGAQTGKEVDFYTDFEIDQDTLMAKKDFFGQLKGTGQNDYQSYIKELEYFKGKRRVRLISLVEQNKLLESARTVRAESLQVLFWICLFSILMSWLFTNFFSKEINRITKAIGNYDQGITDDIDLPTHRKDEIGTLAHTFTKMKAKIDQNVKELNTALEQEQQAKKQRDEFLQNMSHEMRTPLNTILGLTQLLHKQAPSELQRPIINSLERSSNNLAGLIYDVLDHQKLLERKVQMVYRPTNIAEILRDIHSGYKFEALQKGLAFDLAIDEELDGHDFETDPLRLTQIVTNLVVNAIKYTRKGKIDMIAKIASGEIPQLILELKDTGVGILPENLAKINERFFREHEDLSGRYGGYGLGLSIVKQLTELFGGSLKAVSKKGIGSEFRVTIPIKPAYPSKTTQKTPVQEHIVPQFNHRYKILYIEDDPSTVELMKHVLDDEKLLMQHVYELDAIKESLHLAPPDLIISDLMLEGVNLISFFDERIKIDKLVCPLIVVSALEPVTMQQLSPFYFQKPIDIGRLKDGVYSILGANEFKAPDFSNVYSNYDDNPTKVSKVLKLLQEEFTTYLHRIEKVSEMKNQKEWEAIQHKLIAHINNLGLHDLKTLLPENSMDLKKENLDTIYSIFYYYLCCFRFEEYLNSKGRFS